MKKNYLLIIISLFSLNCVQKSNSGAQKHIINYSIKSPNLADFIVAYSTNQLTDSKLTELLDKGKTNPSSYDFCLEIASDNDVTIQRFTNLKDTIDLSQTLQIIAKKYIKEKSLSEEKITNTTFTNDIKEAQKNKSCIEINKVKDNNCIIDLNKITTDNAKVSKIDQLKPTVEEVIVQFYGDTIFYTLVKNELCK